jgi:hypothetical protein
MQEQLEPITNQAINPNSPSPISYLFGGVSCVIAALITHPIDSIKVRLQLAGELSKATKPKENIILNLVRQEGIQILYKGLSPSLLREASYSTIRMGLYEPFKNIMKNEHELKEPLYKKIIAGGMSGLVGSAIANPTDLIKVRFQASNGSMTIAKAVKDIVNHEGWMGLYRGVVPTTQRAVILTATQLPTYDHSKRVLLDSGYFKEGMVTHFTCSMIAGLFVATTTNPIDLVKSRYMNQKFTSGGKGLVYSSTKDCILKTFQAEGFMGFYKGWFFNWMRIGPHTVITFLILEQLRKAAGMKAI